MQILIHLPQDIAMRLKQAIPARKRSSFICELLKKSLPNIDDELYKLALKANEFDVNNPSELEAFTIANLDGLDENETFDIKKLEALCQK